MMASLLTIVGAIMVALAMWATGGDGGTTQATGPTPPADCFVADEPTAGGPAAPSDLEADFSPVEQFLGQTDVSWTDNSDDETCFVLEGRLPNQEFDVIAVLPPNTTAYRDEGPYGEGTTVRYRVCAATASERSEYSNEDNVTIPILEPTPTGPLPTPLPFMRGDLNCNGQIDPVDSLVVLREDAGLDPLLPGPCPSLVSIVQVVSSPAATGLAIGVIGLGAGFLLARRSLGWREGREAEGEDAGEA